MYIENEREFNCLTCISCIACSTHTHTYIYIYIYTHQSKQAKKQLRTEAAKETSDQPNYQDPRKFNIPLQNLTRENAMVHSCCLSCLGPLFPCSLFLFLTLEMLAPSKLSIGARILANGTLISCKTI